MNAIANAIANADAHTQDAGLPSYTELVALLTEAQKLGLTFDCGTAYIRRSYIDKQDQLNARIKSLHDQIRQA